MFLAGFLLRAREPCVIVSSKTDADENVRSESCCLPDVQGVSKRRAKWERRFEFFDPSSQEDSPVAKISNGRRFSESALF
jgi:hypothetical protein